MDDFGFPAPYVPDPAPTPRRHTRRWLVIGGLAVAFALTLALGTVIGEVLHSSAQAAVLNSNISNQPQFGDGPYRGYGGYGGYADNGPQYPMAGTPSARGPCISVTVTKVSGSTITGTERDGTTLTIHTTSSTAYRKAGQSASASAVTVGSEIHVMGTRNSDGSITATSIDIR
jgi:hypothetical protein